MAPEERQLLVNIEKDSVSRDEYGDLINEKELVRYYLNSKRIDEARKYKSAIGKASHHVYPILFARAYEREGLIKEAIKCYAKQIALKHDHRESIEAIGRLSPFAVLKEFDAFQKIKQCIPGYKFLNMFDVGANIGQTVRRYLQFTEDNVQIYSFEPAPESYAKLKEEYDHFPNVHLFQLGISKAASSFTMLCEGASTMNRIIDSPSGVENLDHTQTINCVSLEDFCRDNSIDNISYLKIDTEGHEMEAIEGFGKMSANIDFIEFEVSANSYNKYHTSFQDIYDKLSNLGFYLFHIQEQCNEWTGGGYPVLRRFNAIFINKNIVGEMKGVLSSLC